VKTHLKAMLRRIGVHNRMQGRRCNRTRAAILVMDWRFRPLVTIETPRIE
jgi:hypothetical protein